MKFAAEHASALEDVRANGAEVTLTRVTQTYTPEADSMTSVTTTIGGAALRKSGNPETYKQLSLVESSAPTVLFVPTAYGDRPSQGDTLVWGGLTYTVADVDPLEPDGTLITADLVIKR